MSLCMHLIHVIITEKYLNHFMRVFTYKEVECDNLKVPGKNNWRKTHANIIKTRILCFEEICH